MSACMGPLSFRLIRGLHTLLFSVTYLFLKRIKFRISVQ